MVGSIEELPGSVKAWLLIIVRGCRCGDPRMSFGASPGQQHLPGMPVPGPGFQESQSPEPG